MRTCPGFVRRYNRFVDVSENVSPPRNELVIAKANGLVKSKSPVITHNRSCCLSVWLDSVLFKVEKAGNMSISKEI